MSLFEKIFGPRQKSINMDSTFKTLTAYAPVYRTRQGGLYESALVRAAIHAIANHSSKLTVNIYSPGDGEKRLMDKPNDYQTWGQFLYRARTILEIQNTAFIVPTIDKYGEFSGVYPILPSKCSIMELAGLEWLRYEFRSGDSAAVELSKCAILTRMQYKDDFFGESNTALNPTMDLIDIQNQGIEEAVKSSGTFRFMARMTNFAKPEDLAKEQKRFTAENLVADSGGVLLFPNTWSEVQQIKSAPFVVDADQMRTISESVYNYFGVNEEVLQNKTSGDAWDAFYEGSIEPFAIQLSDTLTNMLFSYEDRQKGGRVMVTTNRLQYMSVKDKISFVRDMGDRGFITINEGREVFNLAPLDGDSGNKMPIRGEYYDNKEESNNDESD